MAVARALRRTHLTLEPGDIVVFPHGDAHVLSSESGHKWTPPLDEEDRES
jgi:hypothetical protein